ncbi:hypothetical protein [Lachnoclostridium sp. Marseille-P6806]|uniref:hypothetical protein n=1 Tax=Lachnoclostridium sp. Marseille-P6806 TaxID=2364793 RepID=UPI0010320D22|nr:hypothetical protein [Lachnoclostridium sp. Marseille-P6806]
MKLGFIDYFLDEWHANHYPAWIRELSGGEIETAYAWALRDAPSGGLTTTAWCEAFGAVRCETQEELIGNSDGILILAPDNCELHESLSRLALRSGKPVYVDKTFSPDAAAARRMFAAAETSGTPCWSASALRFAEEYAALREGCFHSVVSSGPNDFETYSVHQLEPMLMLLKKRALTVSAVRSDSSYSIQFSFEGGAFASLTGYAAGAPFALIADDGRRVTRVEITSDYFRRFTEALVNFFRSGTEPVAHADTIAVMELREAGMRALAEPGTVVRLA